MSCATSVNPKALSEGRQHLKSVLCPESEIQIWIAHLDSVSVEEIQRLFDSLDASERTCAGQFHFNQDRNRYVAAHGLLRLALAQTVGCSATALVLEKSARGKPELCQSEKGARLKFNLSHAAGWTLIAIGWNRELGVDLESSDSLPEDDQSLSKLAARVHSEREFEMWNAIPSPEKRRATFLRTWTRKEAYVKATGKGLRDDLANLEVPADSAPFDVASGKRPTDRWIVHDLSVPTELTAALAIELP